MVLLYIDVLALGSVPRVKVDSWEARILAEKVPIATSVYFVIDLKCSNTHHAARMRVAISYKMSKRQIKRKHCSTYINAGFRNLSALDGVDEVLAEVSIGGINDY